jgi:integrase
MAEQWVDNDLVFATQYGTGLDSANVRRAFRTVAAAAGLEASEWPPRELRHSFVSLLSSSCVPIEDIAHLLGHASTNVTEKAYRKELRPVLSRGAKATEQRVEAVSSTSGAAVRASVSLLGRRA